MGKWQTLTNLDIDNDGKCFDETNTGNAHDDYGTNLDTMTSPW